MAIATTEIDPITLEIMWSRLIAAVDELSANLVRTSFSTVVRECNDFACVLLDQEGRSLVQSSVSVPSFIGTMPITVKHFLRRFPPASLRPGDVLITNDPWLGTGHLPDFSIAIPIFRRGRLVGFGGTVAHAMDVGGRQWGADARQVFEEGLRVPMTKLYIEGEPNEWVFDIIANNVRVPNQVVGDLKAQVAANEVCGRKLLEFMDEYELDDVRHLAEQIQSRSEAAMRRAIEAVPDGEYRHLVEADGVGDERLRIPVCITVRGAELWVDYSGASEQVYRGINSPFNYTYSYTNYPLKCVLDPRTPNNEGCFRPIHISAPEGSILNPRPPAAVNARHLTGHLLQGAVFGALAPVLSQRIQSDSGAPGWSVVFTGAHRTGDPFASIAFLNGGQGARNGKDGMSALAFPTNVVGTPVEVEEALGALRVERKEIIADSGGPGKFRGGCGQRLVYRSLSQAPVVTSLLVDRVKTAAQGSLGGRAGRHGRVLLNGVPVSDLKGQLILNEGDSVVFETPGGGGLYSPFERDPELVRQDVRRRLVTVEGARRDYGVALDPETLEIDEAATVALRAQATTAADGGAQ